jgi:hypothetical protein
MHKDLYTIVYYTSNAENEAFEEKIKANILEHKGDIPLISVSQKPIDFGENICVGQVGKFGLNGFRQTLIGAKAAKTPYIIFAESDFLYPRDYFTFEPPDENECYRHDNVWIVWKDTRFGSYHKKRVSEGAQICGRELLIEMYEKFFEGLPEWCDATTSLKKKEPLYHYPWKWFTGSPCVSFKTGDGLRSMTNTEKHIPHESSLPVWGHVRELRKQYL